jgi:hypothetical protein
MKTTFKSTMSLALVASQLGMSAAAWGSPADAPTPETILLQNAMAIQGSALSSDVMQSQLQGVIADYASNSPDEGRSERLQTALVDMGIYTPDQAAALSLETQASAERLAADGSSIEQEKLNAEMNQILQVQPKGAQFSACDFGQIFGAVGIVAGPAIAVGGFVTLLVGHHIRGETESCVSETVTTTSVAGTVGTVGIPGGGVSVGSGSGTVTTSKQNVCTRASNADANIHSGDVDMQHGRFVINLGAYILAAGALAFIAYESKCDN